MSTPTILIRPATLRDVPAMYDLMFELAVYEKSPELVATSVAEYQTDFENGLFEGFVAEADGKIVGMTLFYTAYSSWKGKILYLDDFVVTESHRRFGIGQMLYDTFIEEARHRGCRMAKWQVLDWNEPAIQFYQKNEADIESGWYNVRKFFVK
jgi:GNAT superfamily N-acetyltransferase